jgi:hypothetical protein
MVVWCAECFSALNFREICLPNSKWCLKSKIRMNVLNWSDRVTIWDVLKGSMSLTEVGQLLAEKKLSSFHSTEANSACWACAGFFLHWGLLESYILGYQGSTYGAPNENRRELTKTQCLPSARYQHQEVYRWENRSSEKWLAQDSTDRKQ